MNVFRYLCQFDPGTVSSFSVYRNIPMPNALRAGQVQIAFDQQVPVGLIDRGFEFLAFFSKVSVCIYV